MARLEDEVLEEFFRRVEGDDQVDDRVGAALRSLFAGNASPKAEAIVELIDTLSEEAIT
ncbi:MAG: hypothetical protein GY745_19420 [Actinomycetia bacterium]|nr:hypothetical protein [Actinomycetes bacterium]